MRNKRLVWLILAAQIILCTSQWRAEGQRKMPWRSLFDGRSLAGWTSPDMSFFTVEDGAITGTVTKDHSPIETLFITREGQTFSDFEMKFRFRISGSKANSGMQFRSKVIERGQVQGYQADIALAGPYTGGIWDEFSTRNSLSKPGFSSTIDSDGKKVTVAIPGAEEFLKKLNIQNWTDYWISARGNHVMLKINGHLAAELVDNEVSKSSKSGVFAMAVITEPMKVQFKDIFVREF